MRKISLFIAMSLDGYIADKNGGVDWLAGQGEAEENIDVYSEFIKEVDTVLMGRKTYQQIITELSPESWPYGDLTTYVVTHSKQKSSEKIRFTDENPVALADRLRKEPGKGIWVCGGAEMVRQLAKEDRIDCYYITVIPIILGSGIALFDHIDREIKLRLVETRSYNGMTDLVYVRR